MPENYDQPEHLRVVFKLDEMDTTELWNHTILMMTRVEACIETAKEQGVELSKDLACYLAVLRDEKNKFLNREGMDRLVCKVITFANTTGKEITYRLINQIVSGEDIPEPHPHAYIFDPKSDLEKKAYQAYEEKYGHIPVRNLTDEDIDKQKTFYFQVLEDLKKQQISKKN